MRYRKGDELILAIEDTFGYDNKDKVYRKVKVQVIGYNIDCEGPDAEYLVYVPPYESLNDTWKLSRAHANWYNVDHKFIDDDVGFIAARHPIFRHIPGAEGEACDRCRTFIESAVREEGAKFLCRSCSLNPYR